MSAIVTGIMIMAAAAIMYPFWPDSAVAGPLWSSVMMAGAGLFSVALGVWWKLDPGAARWERQFSRYLSNTD